MENSNSVSESNEQKDLLSGESFDVTEYVYAGQGQRFLNLVIDNLLMQYGMAYISGMAAGALLALAFPEFMRSVVYGESKIGLFAISYFIFILNYIFYYTLCEKLFKGRTLGKLITGTKALRQDGNELTFRDALLRSLSRLVPFEVFSGFSVLPWHDAWTDTMVVKSR